MFKQTKKYNLVLLILIIVLSFPLDSTAQHRPWTLKGCMRYLDRTIDDTTKYDFKVSPLGYCYYKDNFGRGFRNAMGLWKFNPLTLHFRLRGISHPDDMSSIIEQSFHRYLNDEPIKFRKQKKKYRTYWKKVRIGENYNEVYDELWGKHRIPDSILNREYIKLFYPGRKVRGYFTIIGNIKKYSNSMSFQDEVVEYTAEVTKISDNKITIQVIDKGSILEGFKVSDLVFKDKAPVTGDTVEVDPCMVYLIPDK